MAQLLNKNEITTNLITEIFQNDVSQYLSERIADDEFYSINDEFKFIGEFATKVEIARWYVLKDPDFHNLPDKVMRIILMEEQRIIDQMEEIEDYLIVDIEVKRILGYQQTVYYLFEKI